MKANDLYKFINSKVEPNSTNKYFSIKYDFSKEDKASKKTSSKSMDYNEEFMMTKDSTEFWDDVKDETISDSNNYNDEENKSKFSSGAVLNTFSNNQNETNQREFTFSDINITKKSNATYTNNIKGKRFSSQDNKKIEERNKKCKNEFKNDNVENKNKIENTPKKIVSIGSKNTSKTEYKNPLAFKRNSLTIQPQAKQLELINNLHQREKEKEVKMNKLREESEQIKKKKELENCTFKPKINNSFTPAKKSILNERKDLSIYERTVLWNNRKNDRLEKEKNIAKLQENLECTFAPEIGKNKVEYETPKTVDKPTKKYFERVNNAKKMKEEINQKLNPDYSKKNF